MLPDSGFYLLPPLSTIAVEDPQEWVGRIVKSFKDPEGNFTPGSQLPPDHRPVVKDDPGFSNVEEIIESSRSNAMRLSLVDMFRIGRSHSVSNAPQVQSPKVRRLKMQQEDEYRERVLALEDVKARLKVWHGIRHPVYLIVGVLVSDQVQYAETAAQKSKHEVKVKPPVQLASIAAGLPIPMPDLVEGSMSTSSERKLGFELTATGRRIFAIEYRVLVKRLLSTSGQVDMRPGGIRGDRSFGREEEGMGTSRMDEQRTEIVADPDPFADYVDEEEEDFCFSLDK